ncbi:hypothetical protein BY996DRAFT_1379567 [Phakopsora pachyrhizi]|uniref:Secreted protein n=1 Tax=Phakopsora pachyrhizi TaxID=170000 RepID=A0AAV0AM30_PHAPC|nr:hypothetical protein BY996DRAFT_1379567 [Phakopsora pachyrhizi]CAH7668602.1 hypothetical protein PPACK8108_LOCUS3124 [Phakopsora pachyrhizi]
MNRLYLLNNTFLSIVIQSLILSSIVVEYSSGIRIHDRDFLRSLSITNKLLSRRKISDQNSHPQVLEALHSLKGCPGEICGTLAGEAVSPLLAGANECAQQDMADKIITAAKTEIKDPEVSKKLISLAIEYRKVERNTFPDFSKQPNVDRNSLFCQKVPKNHELDGLIQAQSSTADPNLFFDPKSTSGSTTLTKGSDR